jgi:hypothetical protein
LSPHGQEKVTFVVENSHVLTAQALRSSIASPVIRKQARAAKNQIYLRDTKFQFPFSSPMTPKFSIHSRD